VKPFYSERSVSKLRPNIQVYSPKTLLLRKCAKRQNCGQLTIILAKKNLFGQKLDLEENIEETE
jgi:hypothetical protein